MAHVISVSHDEAVTSLVGYLRKSDAEEIVLILPRRSALVESLVNLRLLKREAESAGKQLVVITQDESSAVAAKRAGLVVRDASYAEALLRAEKPSAQPQLRILKNHNTTTPAFSENSQYVSKQSSSIRPTSDGIRRGGAQNNTSSKENRLKIVDKQQQEAIDSSRANEKMSPYVYSRNRHISNQQDFYSSVTNAKQERMTSPQRDAWKRPAKQLSKNRKISFGKIFVFGIGGIFFIFLGWLAWKYVPEAILTVHAVRVEMSDDISFESLRVEDGAIGMKYFEETITLVEAFSATGSQSTDVRRASGTVTIYNTYDEADQPLVATTRLLTEDGKLYRLTESVVVPGRRMEKGKIIPGSIKANVRADESGEEYNIDPSRFTIPGFSGSPKHVAFYAESEEAFLGGGSIGSDVISVSEEDVLNAREVTEKKAREQAKATIMETLGDNWMLPEDAIEISVREADAFPSEGSVAEKFEYSLVVSVQAIAIHTPDIEASVRDTLFTRLQKKLPETDSTAWIVESVDIEYGYIKPDFETKTLSIQLSAKAKWRAEIDESSLKEAFFGKTTDEIRAMLEMYSGQVEQVDVDIRPAGIVSRVSTVPSRVEVIVK